MSVQKAFLISILSYTCYQCKGGTEIGVRYQNEFQRAEA